MRKYQINVQDQVKIKVDAFDEKEAKEKAFHVYSKLDPMMEQIAFDQITTIRKLNVPNDEVKK